VWSPTNREEDLMVSTATLSRALATLFLVWLTSAQENAALHKRLANQDVINMVQKGLSEDIVIAKIRATSAADPSSLGFDTSVEGGRRARRGDSGDD
jgi:hypothetical protein